MYNVDSVYKKEEKMKTKVYQLVNRFGKQLCALALVAGTMTTYLETVGDDFTILWSIINY